MLSIDECRRILGGRPDLTDEQIAEIRRDLVALAQMFIDRIMTHGSLFGTERSPAASTDKKGSPRDAVLLLADKLWDIVHPHLPARSARHPEGGRPRRDDRSVLRGIAWMMGGDRKWQRIPSRSLGCPSGSTCWRRFREWTALGVWTDVRTGLLRALSEVEMANLDRLVAAVAVRRL